jgi:hypothetical protein
LGIKKRNEPAQLQNPICYLNSERRRTMRFQFRTIVGVFLALLLSLPVVGYSQTELKVGTSGPGSVAYVWVSTLASVLDQFKAPVRIRVAGGVFDVEAIRTMEKGEKGLDASLVTGSTLANAVFSKGPFKGEKVKELRAIFPLGLSPLQIVAAEKSKITRLMIFPEKGFRPGRQEEGLIFSPGNSSPRCSQI